MRDEPAPIEPAAGVRFGRTLIVVVAGDVLRQDVEAIVVAANTRGVLGALSAPGLVGLRSLGGSQIEREAMAQAPLDLGAAIVTGAAGLEPCHIAAVIHAVVHRSLGDTARIEHVRRAAGATLVAADRARLRSVAMPLLGVEADRDDAGVFITAIVDEMVAALRRSTLRLDRVVIACRFDEQAAAAAAAVRRARERAWPRPA
ncbi:MAG TPA: macro domain-containing protein [Thermomicrobiales bacterium]|nr:macro domain-containing protein [Thermomicrobiales bacterium]